MGKTVRPSGDGRSSAKTRKAGARASFAVWSKAFLATLAETSNVTAAAKAAGVTTGAAYDARRGNAGFYRDWQQALAEGYDLLEMEMLRRMREGEVKPAAAARRGVRTWDNAIAFRLLTAHRDATARQRAVRNRGDAEAIVREINTQLERMKQRRLALLPPGDGAE